MKTSEYEASFAGGGSRLRIKSKLEDSGGHESYERWGGGVN